MSEQTTNQTEVVEKQTKPKMFNIKNYKKMFHKERERNEILEKKINIYWLK